VRAHVRKHSNIVDRVYDGVRTRANTSVRTLFNGLDAHIMHRRYRPLSFARIAHAAAAASLPPTATNHMTQLTYGRSSASVVSCRQRYDTLQVDNRDVR